MADNKYVFNELRIPGMPPKLKEDIRNISANMGVTMAGAVKTVLRDWVNGQPENMKAPLKD